MSGSGTTDNTADPSVAPSTDPSATSYSATQATTPSFLTTLESYADPTTHPMFLVIGGLALAALVLMPGKKKKSARVSSSPSKRSITITD